MKSKAASVLVFLFALALTSSACHKPFRGGAKSRERRAGIKDTETKKRCRGREAAASWLVSNRGADEKTLRMAEFPPLHGEETVLRHFAVLLNDENEAKRVFLSVFVDSETCEPSVGLEARLSEFVDTTTLPCAIRNPAVADGAASTQKAIEFKHVENARSPHEAMYANSLHEIYSLITPPAGQRAKGEVKATLSLFDRTSCAPVMRAEQVLTPYEKGKKKDRAQP